MSTDSDALANLLDVAEELLFSIPLPHDVALKYDLIREKTLKKLGLSYSSSKLWRLQHEAVQKLKAKPKELETQEPREALPKLDLSLKIRVLEEAVQNLESINLKLAQILDNSAHSFSPFSKTHDLDFPTKKDLKFFKEMHSNEVRNFEILSSKILDKAKELNTTANRVEERFGYYEKSLQSFAGQVEALMVKSKSEKLENEARVEELLATCHSLNDQLEKTKFLSTESLAHEKKMIQSQILSSYEERVKEMNEKMLESSIQINEIKREFSHKEKKMLEKYSENLTILENQAADLKRELGAKDKKMSETVFEAESQIKELKREALLKEKKLEKIQEDLGNTQEQLNDLLRENTKKSIELEAANKKIDTLKEEISSQKAKLQEAKEDLISARNKAQDFKENNLLRNKCLDLKEELSQSILKLSETREELQSAKIKLAQFKEENEGLKSCCRDGLRVKESLEKISDALLDIFGKYSKTRDEWLMDHSKEENLELQVLNQVDFLNYIIGKLVNDNNWLVDRLAEMGEENQHLRESPKKERVSELKATSNAFRGFENARNKLLYQFNEDKFEGSLNY